MPATCRARCGSSARFRRASSRTGSRRSGRESAPLPCHRGAGRCRHPRTVHRRAGRRPPAVSSAPPVTREPSPTLRASDPRGPLARRPCSTGGRGQSAGAANQPRAILRASARAFPGGSKGGRTPPLASPLYPQRVGWLSDLTVAQASPAAARETLPARRPRRRWPDRLGRIPRPLGHQPHRRRGRTRRPVTPCRRRRSPARPGFHPTRTPRGPANVALRRSHSP